MNALLAGESWQEITTYVKAHNVTSTSSYTEAGEYIIAGLEAAGADVDYQPSHVAHSEFPDTREQLDEYDLVVLSDIGAQTMLVSPEVAAGEARTNRLRLLADWVADGGAVGMVGGYTSFAGENGVAGYGRTVLNDVLPVDISLHDDRIERPGGVRPQNHGIESLPDEWPAVLGYNRLTADGDATVLATVGEDPLLTVGDYGDGRAFAYATDCAEHWAPTEFLEWEHMPDLWETIVSRVV
jgi:uncharacterized membrane protein